MEVQACLVQCEFALRPEQWTGVLRVIDPKESGQYHTGKQTLVPYLQLIRCIEAYRPGKPLWHPIGKGDGAPKGFKIVLPRAEQAAVDAHKRALREKRRPKSAVMVGRPIFEGHSETNGVITCQEWDLDAAVAVLSGNSKTGKRLRKHGKETHGTVFGKEDRVKAISNWNAAAGVKAESATRLMQFNADWSLLRHGPPIAI